MSPRLQPPAAVPVPELGELVVDSDIPQVDLSAPVTESTSAVLSLLPIPVPLAMEATPLSVSDKGSLTELPLSRLLYALYVDGFSGVLTLDHKKALRRIHFSRGGVAMVTSTLLSDHIGRFLIERGDVTPAQFMQLRDQWQGGGEPEAMLWAAVAPTARDAAEQAYIERLVTQAFAWQDATYTLSHGTPASPGRLHPLPLVCRGCCDHYNRQSIVQYFTPHHGGYIRPSTRFNVHWRSVAPLLKTTGVVPFLDGKNMFKAALDVTAGTVPQALYALWSTDMITVSAEPAAR